MLAQTLFYYRLHRKRTFQNYYPLGPSASCSLYLWCQVFTKSATSFLPPTLQPFITDEWTPARRHTYQYVGHFYFTTCEPCWPPVWNLRHDPHNTCLSFKRDVVACYCVYAWECDTVHRNAVLFVCQRSACRCRCPVRSLLSNTLSTAFIGRL